MSTADAERTSALSEHPGGEVGGLMDATAYLALAAGYLLATLSARHLTWYGLALLTALNVLYVVAFRRISSEAGGSEREVLLLSVGLIGVTMAVEALCFIGMGFDWLMPIVTVTLMGIFFPLRRGLAFSSAVWLSTILLLYLLDGRHLTLQDQIELPPAFIFAFVFAVVVRHQFEQRERAEQLVAQLEEAQTRLRAHADEAQELAVTRERNRMAREIHDTLGHYLTILAVQLETATKLEEHGDPRLRAELAEARRVASECLAEVRRSVAALRPADATVTSFAAALSRLTAAFAASQPETELALDIEGRTQELPPELRIGLFRVVQESLTNIRKHTHASKVLVRLRADAEQVELTVLDNGLGAQAGVDGHEPGFGLLGMRERVELLGGTVRAGPEPEHGWRVEVRIPLAADSDDHDATTAAARVLAAS